MFVTRYKTQIRISMCAAIEHKREKESSNYSWPRPSRRRRQPYCILHEKTRYTTDASMDQSIILIGRSNISILFSITACLFSYALTELDVCQALHCQRISE